MTEVNARGLARLAQICLAQAEAFQRASRSYRQTVALQEKLLREAKRAERETRDDAQKQRSLQTHTRRAKVQSALNQLIWNEYENPEAEALEMVVDDRLDDEQLADTFTTEPLEAQVERIRKSIGLTQAEPEAEPPPNSILPDDDWHSSA